MRLADDVVMLSAEAKRPAAEQMSQHSIKQPGKGRARRRGGTGDFSSRDAITFQGRIASNAAELQTNAHQHTGGGNRMCCNLSGTGTMHYMARRE